MCFIRNVIADKICFLMNEVLHLIIAADLDGQTKMVKVDGGHSVV